MRGPIRLIEIAGIVLLLIVLAIVGSRISAESGDPDRSGSSNVAELVERLRLAGLSVTIEGQAHDPRLSVSGRTLHVDGETVEVYAYDDAWTAEAEAARLIDEYGDDLTDWIDAPHLFRDDRLLFIHPDGSQKLHELLISLLNNGANLHEMR